jgi:two-component system, OmpR family, sensor histidine kinase CpxA
MIRGIYAKIFLWFLLATSVTSGAVFLITVITHVQSLGPSWMIGVLDQYARSAVNIYEHGGKERLAEYLREIQSASFLQSTLLDPEGHDIVGRGVPPGAEKVLAEARASGETRFHIGLLWTGASVDERPNGKYILVAKVLVPYGFLLGGAVEMTVLTWLLPALVGALLCLLLARHIATPIRTLQSVAGRIADGDFSVRASPAIGSRKDELADLARDFDRMTDRIQALLRKQLELLGDISHELRSPLTRLNVSLELVRRGKTDAVERMLADLRRLDTLIGQILTLTRLQTRGDRKTETPVNLRSIVEGVAEEARFEGNENGKSVVISRADDCWLRGDPALLRSCIENVVRNALQYTKTQTEVVVSLDYGGGSSDLAQILVADRGDGVPPEALERIFEPFYRVTEAGKHQTDGTGLGLAIAQRIAIVHGGSIRARNRDGGGLEIEIHLPAQNPVSAPPDSVRSSSLNVGGGMNTLPPTNKVQQVVSIGAQGGVLHATNKFAVQITIDPADLPTIGLPDDTNRTLCVVGGLLMDQAEVLLSGAR